MTLVAASGPLSVRTIVYVMVSPTLGVGSLTTLLICRSACCGVSVAAALLLPTLGSNWSLWLTAAVFVWATGLGRAAWTVAWMVRVSGRAAVTVPAAQTPVPLL